MDSKNSKYGDLKIPGYYFAWNVDLLDIRILDVFSEMAKVFIKKDVVDESIEKGVGCDTGATPAIRDFILEKVEDIFDFKVVTVRDGGY